MPARSLSHYYLHLLEDRTQRRVKDNAVVELRHILTHATVWSGPVALLVHSLTHMVTGAAITAEFLPTVELQTAPRRALASAPSRSALRAVGVPLRPVQEARRAKRAARSTGKRRAS